MTNRVVALAIPARPQSPVEPSARQPWGFWSSVGWTVLAVIVGMAAAIAVAILIARWDASHASYQFLFRNGNPAASSVLLVLYSVIIAMLALAARASGSSASEYLGLVRPRGRYALCAILCVVLPLFLAYAHTLAFDYREFFRPHGFDRARAANGLFIHVAMVVIVGPVMEEVVFRGFLYRGLSHTWLGIAGTVVVTSAAWALLHYDKNAAGIIDTAVHGIAWGWLRWHTGSLWAPIASHIAYNGIVVAMILASLYGWVG